MAVHFLIYNTRNRARPLQNIVSLGNAKVLFECITLSRVFLLILPLVPALLLAFRLSSFLYEKGGNRKMRTGK